MSQIISQPSDEYRYEGRSAGHPWHTCTSRVFADVCLRANSVARLLDSSRDWNPVKFGVLRQGFARRLSRRYVSHNSRTRSSFEDICRGFQDFGFPSLPGADPDEIIEVVDEVVGCKS